MLPLVGGLRAGWLAATVAIAMACGGDEGTDDAPDLGRSDLGAADGGEPVDGGAAEDQGTDAAAPAAAPGGFVEPATAEGELARPALVDIVAGLPAAGERFTFPAPYGTEAVRLTDASRCGGADCVRPVGYSYWRNLNAHVGADHLLAVLGLDSDAGGSGLTLFRIDKATLAIEDLGPVLEDTGLPLDVTGEGAYFSGTDPHALYVHGGGRLMRVDVMTKAVETVFDVGPEYGDGHIVWQHHTSDDDRVHSFTLRDATYADVGCAVYSAETESFELFPEIGAYDECQVDRSGRWLVIKENVDGTEGEDNRIIDLQTGSEQILLDPAGAAGHSDLGHGTMVAADNYHGMPGAYRLWDLSMAPDDPGNGTLVYHDTAWGDSAGDHVSHTNASAAPPAEQVACNSRLAHSGTVNPRGGEIVCYRLDGSLDVLVVAPTLSHADGSGGGSTYAAMPKGNLDVTGRWMIWTTNLGGDRLDAFLVRVPLHRLLDP